MTIFRSYAGEDAKVAARKKRHMKSAQERWPFLTNYDCSTIKTTGQLMSMVSIRSRASDEEARKDVEDWMKGRTF